LRKGALLNTRLRRSTSISGFFGGRSDGMAGLGSAKSLLTGVPVQSLMFDIGYAVIAP
jgi:hypothetical protein